MAGVREDWLDGHKPCGFHPVLGHSGLYFTKHIMHRVVDTAVPLVANVTSYNSTLGGEGNWD